MENSIQKADNNLPSKIEKGLKLINSRELPRLRSMDQSKRGSFLFQQMERASALIGVKSNTVAFDAIIEEIDLIIMEGEDSRLKWLTTGHIQLAFRKGCSGAYGEVYRLNLPTILKWFENLRKDEAEAIAKKVKDEERKERNKLSELSIPMEEALPNGLNIGERPKYEHKKVFLKEIKKNLSTDQ